MSRFWEKKSLAQMSREEWESLCDGCARCCLIKLEDEETGEHYNTGIVCRYLKLDSCKCSVYTERTRLVPDCLQVTRENLHQLYFMPHSCAYRLLAEGKSLPTWHPLISESGESVKEAGISACNFAIPEQELPDNADPEDYILD